MSVEIDKAVEFYDQASHAEATGQWDRAEGCYLQSLALFEQGGSAYVLDAAKVLNRLTVLREAFADNAAALATAEHSAQIMESRGSALSGREADEIRLQAWELLGNLYRRMARFAEAESVLQRALGYALTKFGPDDRRTCEARNRLELLYNSTGELAKARDLAAPQASGGAGACPGVFPGVPSADVSRSQGAVANMRPG
jgi:tetratricopeptide (TPR) repeat protein